MRFIAKTGILVKVYPLPVAGLLLLLISLPGLRYLLPSLYDDPDMCYVAPKLMSYEAADLPRLFTESAPWGDGSYRPALFLFWWLDAKLWEWRAQGWALPCWLMGIITAFLVGLLTTRISGSAKAGIVAGAIVALRQSTRFRSPVDASSIAGRVLFLLTAVWALLATRRRPDAKMVAALASGLAIVCVTLETEWQSQTWVQSYVGGQTAVQGGMLFLIASYLAWCYADHGRKACLAGFWVVWALMMLSYEQPLCLPVAMAPAFLVSVDRAKWRRALPLMVGAALLTGPYLWLRWQMFHEQGISNYQIMQLRSSSYWIADLFHESFPVVAGIHFLRQAPPLPWLLFDGVAWSRMGTILAWLWAYGAPLLRKDRAVASVYWWRFVALLPLIRFHQQSHYLYLSYIAVASGHGMLVDRWFERVTELDSARTTDDASLAQVSAARPPTTTAAPSAQ